MWEDISESTAQLEGLIAASLSTNVILPLVISPLKKANCSPLFTLKFSLFVLRRLLPIIYSYGLMDCVL